jgi:hypothetical protein
MTPLFKQLMDYIIFITPKFLTVFPTSGYKDVQAVGEMETQISGLLNGVTWINTMYPLTTLYLYATIFIQIYLGYIFYKIVKQIIRMTMMRP